MLLGNELGVSATRPATVASAMPNTEVLAKPVRRRFNAEYKRRIVAEAEHCQEPGEIGTLLRREGLYSSHLANWRRACIGQAD